MMGSRKLIIGLCIIGLVLLSGASYKLGLSTLLSYEEACFSYKLDFFNRTEWHCNSTFFNAVYCYPDAHPCCGCPSGYCYNETVLDYNVTDECSKYFLVKSADKDTITHSTKNSTKNSTINSTNKH